MKSVRGCIFSIDTQFILLVSLPANAQWPFDMFGGPVMGDDTPIATLNGALAHLSNDSPKARGFWHKFGQVTIPAPTDLRPIAMYDVEYYHARVEFEHLLKLRTLINKIGHANAIVMPLSALAVPGHEEIYAQHCSLMVTAALMNMTRPQYQFQVTLQAVR